MEWFDLAEDRDSWEAVLSAVINVQILKNGRNFLIC